MKRVNVGVSPSGTVFLDGEPGSPLARVENASCTGQDPCLFEEDVCGHCFAADPPNVCSRCCLVHYCTQECQKGHYRKHKAICQQVHRVVEAKEHAINPEAELENISRSANVLKMLALHHNTKLVLEKTLQSELEFLSIFLAPDGGPYDSMAPFRLLMLNRDDDAFQHCKYWTSALCGISASASGDWIKETLNEQRPLFPDEQHSRYRDFFEDLPDADPEKLRLQYLLTVGIIKMRLVTKFEAAKEHGGIPFEDVLGCTTLDDMLSAQRTQMDKLMDQIDAKNPQALPSMLSPSMNSFQGPMLGTLTDYHFITKICILRVPGVFDWLERRYGSNAD